MTKSIVFLDDGGVLILTRDATRRLVRVRYIDAAVAGYYTERTDAGFREG